MAEITYGKTPLGQLIYDLLFTKLTDRYLARKHRMPIADVRKARAAARKGYGEGKRQAKKRGRHVKHDAD